MAGQRVQGIRCLLRIIASTTDRVGCVGGEWPGKEAQPPEQALLRRIQQGITPGNRPTQRALPGIPVAVWADQQVQVLLVA